MSETEFEIARKIGASWKSSVRIRQTDAYPLASAGDAAARSASSSEADIAGDSNRGRQVRENPGWVTGVKITS
jgi:hypothetical protein